MKLKRVDHINVVPFIDIMLVLLVIVLMTATFIQKKSLTVDIPKSSHSDQAHTAQSTIIAIKPNSEIYLDGIRLEHTALKEALTLLPIEQSIELHGDQKSNFEDFVTVMQLLKELNHSKIYIVTQ